MRHVNTGLAWLGLALVTVGLVTTSLAVWELSEGVQELGRHWWSGLAGFSTSRSAAMSRSRTLPVEMNHRDRPRKDRASGSMSHAPARADAARWATG